MEQDAHEFLNYLLNTIVEILQGNVWHDKFALKNLEGYYACFCHVMSMVIIDDIYWKKIMKMLRWIEK